MGKHWRARRYCLRIRARTTGRVCVVSIAGDVEQALSLLSETLAADPGQRALARNDPSLRCLHGDERFWELVGGRTD
jgi:hypothetical protein